MADKVIKMVSLFLKINLPQGKRFKHYDRNTRRIDYKKQPIFLYPDRPTEVTEDEAFMLLQMNENLVSTEPYDETKDPQFLLKQDLEKQNLITGPPEDPDRDEANARFQKSGNKNEGTKGEDGQKPDNDDVVADYMGSYLDKMTEISETGLSVENMNVKELREHLTALDSDFTSKHKAELVQALTDRMNFIAAKIEEQLKKDAE